MKKLSATLALALTLAAQPASAYLLSCGDFIDAFRFGTATVKLAATANTLGVADMLGALLCFGRDPRCACLSSMEARPEAFARSLVDAVMACDPNDALVGAAFNAALDVCS